MPFADSAFADLTDAVTASFGEAYQYSTRDGKTFSVPGSLREPTVLEATAPLSYSYFLAKLSDFQQAPAKGDTIVIGSNSYTVYEIKADLSGAVTLSLQFEFVKQ